MKTTHTPGPWTNTGHDGRQTIVVETKWGSVARVAYAGDLAQQEANARLIASAPELLAALRVASLICAKQNSLSYADRREAHEIVMQAIAKAEGNA